jgi:uncharacterized repeat protein (TIGR01451 family)
VNQSKPLSRTQWYVLIAAFLGWMFDGLEMGLFPLSARPALRDLMSTVSAGVREFPAEAAVGEWYSYLVAVFLLGAALGGLVFGWLGDRMGRVRTMALSILVYAGFTGLCYFATEPWHLAVFRFCSAIGMGGEWALGVALVMECWPEKFRPILAGVIGAAANFGFLSISLIAVLFTVDADHWRWTMLAGAAPGALAFFILALIPESQRWKESVKVQASKPLREIFTTHLAKPALLGIAFASVALIGTWGAVSGFLPLWTDELAGGDRELKVSLAVRSDAPAPMTRKGVESTDRAEVTEDGPGSSKAPKDEKPKYKIAKPHTLKDDVPPGEAFSYKVRVTNQGENAGTRVTLTDRIPLDTIDPASVSFELTGLGSKRTDDKGNVETIPAKVEFDAATGELVWEVGALEHKDPHAKGWTQTALSIGAIIGCFLAPMLGHWLSRRLAYFILCTLSLISCAYLFRFLDAYDAWFVVVTGFVGLVTASFYGWLPLYLPELFPTRVRATGQGVAFNSGRILAAVGALTTGQLMHAFGGSYPKACATIALVYLVGMVLIWLAPETKGRPLPE